MSPKWVSISSARDTSPTSVVDHDPGSSSGWHSAEPLVRKPRRAAAVSSDPLDHPNFCRTSRETRTSNTFSPPYACRRFRSPFQHAFQRDVRIDFLAVTNSSSSMTSSHADWPAMNSGRRASNRKNRCFSASARQELQSSSLRQSEPRSMPGFVLFAERLERGDVADRASSAGANARRPPRFWARARSSCSALSAPCEGESADLFSPLVSSLHYRTIC